MVSFLQCRLLEFLSLLHVSEFSQRGVTISFSFLLTPRFELNEHIVVFVLYDFYVERRQKLVMNKAERSSAIVSSLFPSTVRDRLEVPTVKAPPEKNPFKRNNGKLDHLHVESDEVSPLVGPPIANLYPETTILCKYINRTT